MAREKEMEKETCVDPKKMEWQEFDPNIKGFYIKVLHKDEKTGAITILSRVTPECGIGVHEHPSDEEFYVVSGTFKLGPHTLTPGMYYRVPRKTMHGPYGSPNEAIVLLVYNGPPS